MVGNMNFGKVLHLYGYPCSGKTTIGKILAKQLNAIVLDGDDVRSNLNSDLGFTKEDRNENLRRFGALADLLSRQGFNVIICTVSPYQEGRDKVKDSVNDYTSIFINTPLEVCIERDVKGMYKEALAGTRHNFTGIHSYIEIGTPDLIIEPNLLEEQIQKIIQFINTKKVL